MWVIRQSHIMHDLDAHDVFLAQLRGSLRILVMRRILTMEVGPALIMMYAIQRVYKLHDDADPLSRMRLLTLVSVRCAWRLSTEKN